MTTIHNASMFTDVTECIGISHRVQQGHDAITIGVGQRDLLASQAAIVARDGSGSFWKLGSKCFLAQWISETAKRQFARFDTKTANPLGLCIAEASEHAGEHRDRNHTRRDRSIVSGWLQIV